jgi:hypothetical protein
MRLVKPEPGPLIVVATMLPATRSTFGTEVVSDPVLLVALESVLAATAMRGFTGSSLLYSRMRISGYAAVLLKHTVTMFPEAAPMFGAKYIAWLAWPARTVGPTAWV